MLTVTATAFPVCAATPSWPGALQNKIERTVTVQQAKASPVDTFNQRIQKVTDPETQTSALLEALSALTTYNEVFESVKDVSLLRELAFKLEGPVAVPWNTYRGNGLKEIFDEYVPNSHGDKKLAKLEYYVKYHTTSLEILNQANMVTRSLPANFKKSYTKLTTALANQTTRDNKALIGTVVAFIPAYNELAAKDPVLAKSLKKSIFSVPLQTGWDKSLSVRDLVFELGLRVEAGGDYIYVRSAKQLAEDFNASPEEAALLIPFVNALH